VTFFQEANQAKKITFGGTPTFHIILFTREISIMGNAHLLRVKRVSSTCIGALGSNSCHSMIWNFISHPSHCSKQTKIKSTKSDNGK